MSTCPTCKSPVNKDNLRCPRCNTKLMTIKGCENCKGCSLFGKNIQCK